MNEPTRKKQKCDESDSDMDDETNDASCIYEFNSYFNPSSSEVFSTENNQLEPSMSLINFENDSNKEILNEDKDDENVAVPEPISNFENEPAVVNESVVQDENVYDNVVAGTSRQLNHNDENNDDDNFQSLPNEERLIVKFDEPIIRQKCSSLIENIYNVNLVNREAINMGLDQAFREIARQVLQRAEGLVTALHYMVRIIFSFTNDVGNEFHFIIPYFICNDSVEAAIDYILNRLERCFQSGSTYYFNNFKVNIAIFFPARGHTPIVPTSVNFDGYKIFKQHLMEKGILIPQKGCAFIAAILGKRFYLEYNTRFNRAKQLNALIKESEQLAVSCELDFEKAVGSTEFEKIEMVLNCRLYVFTHDDSNERNLKNVYTPRNTDLSKKLIIIGHEGEHYFPVKDIRYVAKFGRGNLEGNMCTGCLTFHTNLGRHKSNCMLVCGQCNSEQCTRILPEGEEMIPCLDCRRIFYNENCLNLHKELNTCKKVLECSDCHEIIMKDEYGHFPHDCKNISCRTCNRKFDGEGLQPHHCMMSKGSGDGIKKSIYMNKLLGVEDEGKKNEVKNIIKKYKKQEEAEERVKKRNVISVYFDIETYVKISIDEKTGKEMKELEPFCFIAQTVCYECTRKEPKNAYYNGCEICGERTIQFKINDEKVDPVQQFIKHLIMFSNKYLDYKIRLFSHNGSAFDHQFIFKNLILNYGPNIFSKDPFVNGRKLIHMAINNNVEFKDTFLFTQCSLTNFPKTMGIDDLEVSKSFFPYKFLTYATLNYIGLIPDHTFFETAKMNKETLIEFEKFYKGFSNKEYNIQEECLKYCVQDVTVLRICFEKYRLQIIVDFDIDPGVSANTIASLVHKIFRKDFMPKDTIGIIDRNITRNYSFESIRWLSYLEKTENITNLCHARNGGERAIKIENKLHYADGIGKLNGVTTVFMFMGCFYHGHIGNCSIVKQEKYLGEISHADRYKKTIDSLKRLKSKYNVMSIWECEWAEKKKETMTDGRSIKEYVKELTENTFDKVLHAGQSLLGGRTNPFVYYYPPTKGFKIQYMDFTSLYPYVQKNNPFPIGVAKHILKTDMQNENFIEDYINGIDTKYFGLVYINILPPKNLYMPVIPVSLDKKLVFPLCMECAKNESGECNHTDKQRTISGVYTSPEIKLALDKGYKILDIYEIWSFDQSKDLFTKYVNYFLGQKTEASGFPRHVVTENDKDDYIAAYEQREGVKLRKEQIKKNPGRRFIAKLALNSLWGKFAQRVKIGNMWLCRDDYEAEKLISDATKEVTQLDQVFQGYVAKYNHTEFSTLTSACTNIPIASFTTAYARVKLYKLLDFLGERVLYADTDSAIFVTKPGDKVPETGVFLGELTDEISDEYGSEAYADSFVSTSPKSYALRIRIPKEDDTLETKYHVRSKGVCMNTTNRDIITFENMIKLVADDGARHVEKCNDKKLSQLSVIDEKRLEQLRNDVTVKAIEHIIGETPVGELKENYPHSYHNVMDDQMIKYIDTSNDTQLQLLASNPRLQPGKLGGMVSLDGTKIFRVTGKKRYLIPYTFRSIPFGFNGDLKPI